LRRDRHLQNAIAPAGEQAICLLDIVQPEAMRHEFTPVTATACNDHPRTPHTFLAAGVQGGNDGVIARSGSERATGILRSFGQTPGPGSMPPGQSTRRLASKNACLPSATLAQARHQVGGQGKAQEAALPRTLDGTVARIHREPQHLIQEP